MKVSNLMGVPNAQINAYIRKLGFYQSRVARGHRVALPEMPTFANFFNEDSDEEGANPIDQFDSSEPSEWGEMGDETEDYHVRRSSHFTDHSVDSNYTTTAAQSLQSRKIPALEGKSQRAELLARKYGALILEDTCIGNSVQRTPKGDPLSAKTYGWRLVGAKQVVNPLRIIPFAETLNIKQDGGEGEKADEDSNTKLIYIGVGGYDDLEKILQDMSTGPSDKLREASSENPHVALAYSTYSSWRCKKSKSAIHDPLDCVCENKTKKMIVCATATDQSDDAAVVPLRVETFVWRPQDVDELQAYADFAKDVACEHASRVKPILG
jgi:hypothetical protein